jgi:murein DD-endopeptidase MepM/ murein hydrolase activator NlpD
VVGSALAGLAAMPTMPASAGVSADTGGLSAAATTGPPQESSDLGGTGQPSGEVAGSDSAAGTSGSPAEEPVARVPVVAQSVNVALGTALAEGLAVANRPPPPPPPARASRSRTDPVTGEEVSFARPGTGRLTSQYGRRWGRLHAGIDLAAGVGAPIFAVTDATVMSAGSEGGYGRAIRLLHDDGTVSVYGHLSQILVSDGARVEAGEQIGEEGNTGHSTGPHLHFEIRIGGTPVDPMDWLRERGIDG